VDCENEFVFNESDISFVLVFEVFGVGFTGEVVDSVKKGFHSLCRVNFKKELLKE